MQYDVGATFRRRRNKNKTVSYPTIVSADYHDTEYPFREQRAKDATSMKKTMYSRISYSVALLRTTTRCAILWSFSAATGATERPAVLARAWRKQRKHRAWFIVSYHLHRWIIQRQSDWAKSPATGTFWARVGCARRQVVMVPSGQGGLLRAGTNSWGRGFMTKYTYPGCLVDLFPNLCKSSRNRKHLIDISPL